MSVRLVEQFAGAFAGARVDREAGIVRGVLLCGASSQNGRDYPPRLWPKSIGKYEGVPIHGDHARERRIGDRIGWVTNARVVDGKPRGDANFLTSHPLVPPVLEAAERNPGLFGFSHVCHADTRRAGGRETVESIERVEALDLVASPATTSSLFESLMSVFDAPRPAAATYRGTTVTTLRKVLERKLTAASRRRFAEALAADPTLMDAPVDEPAFDAGADEAVNAAIGDAGASVWKSFVDGKTDIEAALKKLRALARAHAAVSASAGPAEESRSGVHWDGNRLRLSEADPAGRASFVESITGRRPTSAVVYDRTAGRLTFTD